VVSKTPLRVVGESDPGKKGRRWADLLVGLARHKRRAGIHRLQDGDERVDVERGQRAIHRQRRGVVTHKQRGVVEPHVGFDTDCADGKRCFRVSVGAPRAGLWSRTGVHGHIAPVVIVAVDPFLPPSVSVNWRAAAKMRGVATGYGRG
jgi:hypothetical protein